MRKAPIFRDAYEVTESDLTDLVTEIKRSDDDVAYDGISRGRKFTGLVVTQTSATQINAANGRLWFDGKRYYSDDSGGVTLDLLPLKPTLQKKVVAIVAWPEEIDADLEYRDFETDAETQVKEPRQVNVKKFRHARLEAVGGAQAVAPVDPVIDSSAVVVAWVDMDTTGITGVRRNDAAVLYNVDDIGVRVDDLEDWRELVGPQIDSLASQIADIQGQLSRIGNQQLILAIARDTAEIKEKLDLPATYVAYRSDFFFDNSGSDTAFAGYSAKTEEGLRFAPEAIAEAQLELYNPYNPDVIVSATGIVLPKYNEIASRLIAGGGGIMALAQYAFETRTVTLLTQTRFRARYGDEFEVSSGGAWFLSGQYSEAFSAGANYGAVGVFRLAGETFQVYESGNVDPDGHRMVRLRRFWDDGMYSPYWSRITTDASLGAQHAFVETFVAPRDSWVTALTARVARKPASGDLYVGICETTDGQPDLTRMLTLANKPSSWWTAEGGLGFNKVPINPIFLKGGQRYGYVFMTSTDYWIQVIETGTAPTTGTMFYSLNGGIWEHDANRHILLDIYYAAFLQNQVSYDLQSLSLSGGIASIDVLAPGYVPESCTFSYQVNIGGAWVSLREDAASSILAGLPPVLPFRALVTGTADVMPGLCLQDSRVRISRPKLTLKHVSLVHTLDAPTTSILTKTRLRNFDAAHHTHVQKVLTGGSFATVDTADTVVDVVRGELTERTCAFSPSSTSAYKLQIEETTDDAANLFVTDSATEIAL